MQVLGFFRSYQSMLSKRMRLFMFAMVLANISASMYEPLLPLYLKDLGASVTQIGLFFTLARIIPLALQILGGWISDSLGRLRSIAIGSLAGIFSYLGIILAPAWQYVLVGEGLASVTRSLVGPSFMAFIAEESSEKTRAQVFGLTEMIYMIVAVIGPPLGAWLAGGFGFKLMLVVALILYTIATTIRVLMAKEAAKSTESSPQKLTMMGLRTNMGLMLGMLLAGGLVTWILFTDGVADIAWTISYNLMPVYQKEIGGLSIQQIGLIQAVFGVSTMSITIPAGILADKKGERYSISAGFAFQFLAFYIFTAAEGFWGFAAAASILGLSSGMMNPAYGSLISKAVPEKLRGTAYGLFNTSLGIISLPAPAIGALLWERVNPSFPFRLIAWISLIAVPPAWVKFKISKSEYVESPVEA